ncbi:MAG: SIR2 family protein [Pseudomonadota bacterium]
MICDCEQKLVNYLASAKVIPFIGSGLSCNVDLPSWGNVVESMVKQIGQIEGEEFFDTAQRFENTCGRDELIGLLRQELHLDRVNTDKLDVHLAIMDFRFLDIFTTNQDLVLEAVLSNLNIPHVPIRCHKDLREAKALSYPRIVKFHGDLIQTDEIVFTKKDVRSRMEAPHPFDIYLQGRLIENAILFIGYGLRDPNVTAVWERVRKYSTPGCEPVAFCLMIQENEAEIERMTGLGIEPVLVSVADRSNPLELLNWLHEIRSKSHENFFRASMEYLFHGKLAPAQTLTRSQLRITEKKLADADSPDEILKEAVYFQRIPQILKSDVEKLLLQHIDCSTDFIWMWEVAFAMRMPTLAETVLRQKRNRQTASRTDMFANIESTHVIIQHFDEWAMSILMAHLEELKLDKGSEETLRLHVHYLFDVVDRHYTSLDLSNEDNEQLEALLRFYKVPCPAISGYRRFSRRLLGSEKRMSDGMRRAHVYATDEGRKVRKSRN